MSVTSTTSRLVADSMHLDDVCTLGGDYASPEPHNGEGFVAGSPGVTPNTCTVRGPQALEYVCIEVY